MTCLRLNELNKRQIKEERKRDEERGGYIYLIKAESEPPRYKIGMSRDVHKRYKQLKECCPFPLRLIKYMKVGDMRVEEKILHEKMDRYRVWGEWFIFPYHLIISINDWFIPSLSYIPFISLNIKPKDKEEIIYEELPM